MTSRYYHDHTKRMFIGYTKSKITGQGKSDIQEIWITYVKTAHGPEAHTYNSRDRQGMTAKISVQDKKSEEIDWATVPSRFTEVLPLDLLAHDRVWWAVFLVHWYKLAGELVPCEAIEADLKNPKKLQAAHESDDNAPRKPMKRAKYNERSVGEDEVTQDQSPTEINRSEDWVDDKGDQETMSKTLQGKFDNPAVRPSKIHFEAASKQSVKWFNLSSPISVANLRQAWDEFEKTGGGPGALWSIPIIKEHVKKHSSKEPVPPLKSYEEPTGTWDDIIKLLRRRDQAAKVKLGS